MARPGPGNKSCASIVHHTCVRVQVPPPTNRHVFVYSAARPRPSGSCFICVSLHVCWLWALRIVFIPSTHTVVHLKAQPGHHPSKQSSGKIRLTRYQVAFLREEMLSTTRVGDSVSPLRNCETDSRYNTPQHNTSQRNTARHSTTQHKTSQRNTTQHNSPIFWFWQVQARGGGGVFFTSVLGLC